MMGRMTRMTDEIRDRIDTDLVEARESRNRGEWIRCWELLEDAHVLSQPWAWPHTRVHAAMLVAAWRSHDRREIRGQVLRLLVGGPASTFGRYPIGNTGRARVPATQPMSVRPDLAEILKRAGQRVS